MASNKIEINEKVVMTLKNGEIFFGKIVRYPETEHQYWYIVPEGDTSLFLVREDSIKTIVRASDTYLEYILSQIETEEEGE